MRQAARAVAAAGLGLALVAGCADEGERYCDELAGSRDRLRDLATSAGEGQATLEQTGEVLRDLRSAAPGDIADEWTTLVFAYEELVQAFGDAGVAPGDYDPSSPPGTVTREERRRIEGAAAELASTRVVEAADALEQHARDVCKVDLGLGSAAR